MIINDYCEDPFDDMSIEHKTSPEILVQTEDFGCSFDSFCGHSRP